MFRVRPPLQQPLRWRARRRSELAIRAFSEQVARGPVADDNRLATGTLAIHHPIHELLNRVGPLQNH